MESKHPTHYRLYSLFVVGALALAGCTNGDFSFDDIDATMGFGGDSLVIPNSSTENIQLSDVLELEQGGSVEIDKESGDYKFNLAEKSSTPANPIVDRITLNPGNHTNHAINVPVATGEVEPTTVAMFEYHGASSKIQDLDNVTVNASSIKLTFNFQSGMSSHVRIKTMTINMPDYLLTGNVTVSSGSAKIAKSGSTLTLTDVSTASQLVINIPVTGMNFKGTDTSLGGLDKITGGNINLNGKFKMGLETQAVGASSANTYRIDASIDVSQMTVTKATGKFDPEIDITNLGSISVKGIPDFLSDSNVKVDLYNPQIIIKIVNNMDVAAKITKGNIISTKNGRTLATIILPQMSIHKNAITEICICRRNTPELTAQYGAENVYVVENLSALVETVPDMVRIEGVEVKADASQTATIELGHQYNVEPSYKVNAPLAFSENANIVYTDNLDGWNDDIKDLDLSDKAYLQLTGDAESKMPMYLTIDVTPVDVNGNDLSGKINVEIPNKIIGSSNGETPASSKVVIKITQKEKDALKELDGLKFTVTGSAKTDGQNNVIEGITLNAHKHTLKLNNIKVKIVGKVIADFN